MGNATIAPLFDRLIDEDIDVPFEKNPKKYSSREEYQTAIMIDLSRLLNTRVSMFWRNYAEKNKVVLPFLYGVSVTGVLSADSVFELQELEARIEAVIAQFEPRLVDTKCSIQTIGNDHASLFINIDAAMIFENRRAFISFPVVIDV
ncbi:hypothetical protein FACS1894122_04720 [Alphaproteobacteria bacterium]|nr:hypothetical protein FACS1894122_04720 [Alphaproteobacteria bacterium]